VDQLAKRPSEDQIKVGKTVSVAVNAQDAERLSLAAEFAELNLVLRGVGDDVIVEKTWNTISDARLTSMNKEIFTEYKKIKGSESRGYGGTVKIYNGGQVAVVQTN
jgi:Flp pilus assembly protein CpaB